MNGRLSQKPKTSEKRKARQYGAAGLLCILAVIMMTVIRLVWGNIMLGSGGDQISLGLIIFYVRNILLLFGGIDIVSAIYHFVIWSRNGRQPMDDDNDSLFSDWKSGERSPVKVSLVLMAGMIALALVLIVQLLRS